MTRRPHQQRSTKPAGSLAGGARVAVVGTIAIGLVLVAARASAGGFAVSEQSAVAGGTGGASTARQDDPGAAWYNPAALADGAGFRLGVGALAAVPSLRAEALDGSWSARSRSEVSTPPHLYASFGSGDWAAGIAIGVPFGSGVTWPQDWEGRHEIVSSRLFVLRVSPFVAGRFGRLRVAAGVHADYGSLQLARTLDFVDADGDVRIRLSDVGFGAHASAFVEATPQLDVGLTYKSRTSLSMSGGADFSAPAAFNTKIADQNASVDMTMPDRIVAGARFARGRWAVLADVELTLWRVNDQIVIDFENEATPDVIQRSDWSSTVSLRAGAELLPSPLWVIRAGAFYDPSPASADTLAPSSPDSDRVGLTIGGSRDVGRGFGLDAFYELMHLRSRDSRNMEALAARYGGRAHLFGIGVRYAP